MVEAREPSARIFDTLQPALVEQFELLATAREGVAQIRELIRTLAIQGRLVVQNSGDVSSHELVKQIAAQKQRTDASGRSKAIEDDFSVDSQDVPFELPATWTWVRFGSIGSVGSSCRVHQSDWHSRGVPFYRAREIVTLCRDGVVANDLFISEQLYETLSKRGWVPEPNDVMITGVGTIGVPYVVKTSDRFYFKDASVLIFKNHYGLNPEYLSLLFRSPYWIDTIHAESMGTTVHTLTIARASAAPIPLPPLAEQARIVSRVDELMRLCDALEAKGRLEAEQHSRLLSTLLGTLIDSVTPDELTANWQRVADHFDLLLDRPEAVNALEQTILQLAVRGLLVPQAPSDEPASDLVRRIRIYREEQLKAGLAKREKRSLARRRFDELIEPAKPISYGVLVPGPEVSGGVPFVRIADLSLTDPPAQPKKSISSVVDAQYQRTRLEGGEILMGVVGSIGKLGVAPPSWAGANIARAICRIVPVGLVDKDFVLLLLQSEFMRDSFAGDTRTLAQPTLNVGLIRGSATPLPPIAEQTRVVARVTELRRLCANLRHRLDRSSATQALLAGALIEQALAA